MSSNNLTISPPIPPANKQATPKEIAHHLNSFLDELRWFRDHNIKVHIKPTAKGWNLKFVEYQPDQPDTPNTSDPSSISTSPSFVPSCLRVKP